MLKIMMDSLVMVDICPAAVCHRKRYSARTRTLDEADTVYYQPEKRCLYGMVIANIFMVLGIAFTVNYCRIQR